MGLLLSISSARRLWLKESKSRELSAVTRQMGSALPVASDRASTLLKWMVKR